MALYKTPKGALVEIDSTDTYVAARDIKTGLMQLHRRATLKEIAVEEGLEIGDVVVVYGAPHEYVITSVMKDGQVIVRPNTPGKTRLRFKHEPRMLRLVKRPTQWIENAWYTHVDGEMFKAVKTPSDSMCLLDGEHRLLPIMGSPKEMQMHTSAGTPSDREKKLQELYPIGSCVVSILGQGRGMHGHVLGYESAGRLLVGSISGRLYSYAYGEVRRA